MQKPDTLIRTKLCPPSIRQGLVSRPRLQEQVVHGLRGPLMLITAPAGFGKTTVVVTGITGCRLQTAWLSLDQSDNQPGRFLAYLIAALRSADQRIGGDATQLIAGMQPAPPEAVLTSLINDLDTVAGEMCLVLDDYQFINSQDIHKEVTFLLEHCPRNFHLLIATRSDPPLPLARLRARGQLAELRAADLRFTASEAAQFLNDVMGFHLDAKSVAVLEERTEGWIAGLQMAALSMRDRKDISSFIKGFSGTHRYILDYLLEEVLAHQPPETQQFLLCTSILERLSAPLCDALLKDQGGDSSSALLDHLERGNLFLISLDDQRLWFRYHHLFADLLKARLQQIQPDLIPMLHRRASTWLEQNGFIVEAIQHQLAAHEQDRAAELIERYGPGRWAENDPSVMQMADSLPPEMLIARPKVGLYQAWFLIYQGSIERAVPLLKEMAQHLAVSGPNAGLRWMQTVITLALAFLSRDDPLPDDQLLEEIPREEPILRDAADVLYGMALGRRGELDRAAEVAIRCIRREAALQSRLAIPSLIPFLAVIHLTQGRLHAAASLYREYLSPIRDKGVRFIPAAGNMEIVMGDVLYEWNRLDEAEKYIRDGLQANEPWHNIMTDALGLLALALVLQAKGEYAEAMQVVEKFEARLQTPLRPQEFQEEFQTLRVRVQLASGDLQKASQWAEQIQHNEHYRLHQEYYRLTLARIYLAQGKYAEIEKMLIGMPPLIAAMAVGTGNRITRQIESNLLLAAASAGQGRLPEAFGLIESSLAAAEPEGYTRVFLDVGEPVRELLTAYLRSPDSGYKPYAQKVLDAFSSANKAGASCSQPDGLIEPLSARELEVLNLMALGKTNQEIARQLIVAAGTIKAHTASIYRKLNASNRTEAVARARQLGLLS